MVDQSTYDGIINYIHDLESKNNPFYEINRDVKIHKVEQDPFYYRVEFSVEYISCRPDGHPIWRKWNTKNTRIDIDGSHFLACVRDSKIDLILKNGN